MFEGGETRSARGSSLAVAGDEPTNGQLDRIEGLGADRLVAGGVEDDEVAGIRPSVHGERLGLRIEHPVVPDLGALVLTTLPDEVVRRVGR